MRALILIAILSFPLPGFATDAHDVFRILGRTSLSHALSGGSGQKGSNGDLHTISKAVFTGGVRPTPGEALKTIVAWDAKRGYMENPARTNSFRREFEFEDAGKRHWIPVFETGDAARFLKAGEQVEIYLVKPSEKPLHGAVYVRGIKHGYDRVPYPLVNDQANEEAIALGQAAQAAVKRVDECLARFAREQPKVGVPPTLAALGPAGTGCLDEPASKGNLGRYAIDFWPGVRDASGRTQAYLLCAHPVRDLYDGYGVFVSDEHGPVGGHQGLMYGGPRNCADSAHWAYDPMRHMKACLVMHADSSTGYAASLKVFGPQGNGCLTTARDADKKLFDTLFVINDEHVKYEPDKSVPRTRFRLIREGTLGRHDIEYVTTETGSHHAGLARKVTSESPDPDTFIAQRKAEDLAEQKRLEELRAACEANRHEDCLAGARLAVLMRERPVAVSLWRKACEGGVAEACLFDVARISAYLKPWKDKCHADDMMACAIESENGGERIYWHAMDLKRLCEDGKRESCDELAVAAQRFANGEPVIVPKRAMPRVYSTIPK